MPNSFCLGNGPLRTSQGLGCTGAETLGEWRAGMGCVLDTSSGVPQAPFSASVLFPEAAVSPVTPPDSCLVLKR